MAIAESRSTLRSHTQGRPMRRFGITPAIVMVLALPTSAGNGRSSPFPGGSQPPCSGTLPGLIADVHADGTMLYLRIQANRHYRGTDQEGRNLRPSEPYSRLLSESRVVLIASRLSVESAADNERVTHFNSKRRFVCVKSPA